MIVGAICSPVERTRARMLDGGFQDFDVVRLLAVHRLQLHARRENA